MIKLTNFEAAYVTYSSTERKGGFVAELWDRGQTKGACIVPPVIFSLEPSLPQMLIICQPFTRRITKGWLSEMEQWGRNS